MESFFDYFFKTKKANIISLTQVECYKRVAFNTNRNLKLLKDEVY
jgi:hypothetical protein